MFTGTAIALRPPGPRLMSTTHALQAANPRGEMEWTSYVDPAREEY
jgi:hypothetical protein